MPRIALILVISTLLPGLAAADKPNVKPRQEFIIECQKPDTLTAQTTDGKSVFTIQGDGIGHATVKCGLKSWPQEITLRIKLKGLESLTIANEKVEWKVSVSSHSGHPTLQHLWRNGKEGQPLEKSSPYWVEIRRFDPDGKPATGLPPSDGWFELRIPQEILTGVSQVTLSWIDFYR